MVKTSVLKLNAKLNNNSTGSSLFDSNASYYNTSFMNKSVKTMDIDFSTDIAMSLALASGLLQVIYLSASIQV